MKNFKGFLGERKTRFRMWVGLDSKIYRLFHDLIIPGKNGTTQVDHLVISPFGVFIVETRNRKGWIFGSLRTANWT